MADVVLPAYTVENIAALKEAIASGATTVHYSDKSVTYRSLSELKETLATMTNEVLGVTKRRRVTKVITAGDKAL